MVTSYALPDWRERQLQRALRIDHAFRQFHEQNPHVYKELVALALRLRAKGHDRIGIGMLFEVLRHERMLHTTDPEGFKLNNNYRSRYARLIMEQEPALAGVFELRELRP